ncbi:MAG: hypothetical protein JNM94_08870 [Phycisphaerae bacterium]|nr:hypothetical protein [Phycisphaerae bacterium]
MERVRAVPRVLAIAMTIAITISLGAPSDAAPGMSSHATTPNEERATAAPSKPLVDATVRGVESIDVTALRREVEAAAGANFRIAPWVVVASVPVTGDEVAREVGGRLGWPIHRPRIEVERSMPASEWALRAARIPGFVGGVRGAPIAVDGRTVASWLAPLGASAPRDAIVYLEVVRHAALGLVDERVGINRFLNDPQCSDLERAWRAAILDAWAELVVTRVAAAKGLEAALRRREEAIDAGLRCAAYAPRSARFPQAARLLAVAMRSDAARALVATAVETNEFWSLLERPPRADGNAESRPLDGVPPALVAIDAAYVEAALARVRPAMAAALGDDVTAAIRIVPCDRRNLAPWANWRPRAAPSPPIPAANNSLPPCSALVPDRWRSVRRGAATMVAALDPRSGDLVVHHGQLSEALADVDPARREAVAALLLAHAASAAARPHVFAGGAGRVPADSEAALVVAAIDDAHALWAMRRVAAAAGLESALADAERLTPRERERRALEAHDAGTLALEREFDGFVRQGLPAAFDRVLAERNAEGLAAELKTPPPTVADLRALVNPEDPAAKDALLTAGEDARRLRRLRDLAAVSGCTQEFVSTTRVTRELIDQFDLADGPLVEAFDRAVRRMDALRVVLPPDDKPLLQAPELIVVRLRGRGDASAEDRARVDAALRTMATTLAYRARAAVEPTVRPTLAFAATDFRRVPWAETASFDGTRPIHVAIGRRGSVAALVVSVGPVPGGRTLGDFLDAALDRD